MRAQRMQRSARPASLMRDPRRAAPGKDAHAVAGAERLVGFLHDGDVLAGVEQHRHLEPAALVGGFLDVLPDDASHDRAADGARDLAVASPQPPSRAIPYRNRAGSASPRPGGWPRASAATAGMSSLLPAVYTLEPSAPRVTTTASIMAAISATLLPVFCSTTRAS